MSSQPNTLRFSAPSKTFIVGEYAVLNEGPCLVLTTEPHFVLSGHLTDAVGDCPCPSGSPAAQLWQDHASELAAYAWQFHDPHQGAGGFGASGAQFLLCWQAMKQLQGAEQESSPGADAIEDILSRYQTYAHRGDALLPSGMDIAAQWLGGVACCEKRSNSYSSHAWPFSKLAYMVVRTGHKLVTHSHVASLSAAAIPDALSTTALQAQHAFKAADQHAFIQAITTYGQQLAEADWVEPTTQALLTECTVLPGVKAAKGCGAMGAEVMLLLVEASSCPDVLIALQERGLDVVSWGHG